MPCSTWLKSRRVRASISRFFARQRVRRDVVRLDPVPVVEDPPASIGRPLRAVRNPFHLFEVHLPPSRRAEDTPGVGRLDRGTGVSAESLHSARCRETCPTVVLSWPDPSGSGGSRRGSFRNADALHRRPGRSTAPSSNGLATCWSGATTGLRSYQWPWRSEARVAFSASPVLSRRPLGARCSRRSVTTTLPLGNVKSFTRPLVLRAALMLAKEHALSFQLWSPSRRVRWQTRRAAARVSWNRLGWRQRAWSSRG